MTTPTHPTLGQRLTGRAAALAVLGIVLGLPALFLAIGASPIPDQVPTLDGIKNALLAPDDGTLVLGLFKVIGWVAWAFMALSLVVETIARLRKVQAPQLPGLGRPQAAARGLIGLAALLFIAARSEEHTSELQSLMRISYAVFCLKKKKNNNKKQIYTIKLYKYINLNKTHQ